FAWPVKSEKMEGRSVISSAASGLVRTSEIGRSGIRPKMGKHPKCDKGNSCDDFCRGPNQSANLRIDPPPCFQDTGSVGGTSVFSRNPAILRAADMRLSVRCTRGNRDKNR